MILQYADKTVSAQAQHFLPIRYENTLHYMTAQN
jgi:hypothetical protein